MKLEITNLSIEKDDIKGVLDFAVAVSDITKGRYPQTDLIRSIEEQVSHNIASTILLERSSDIMEKINIDEIIKRVQLNIVINLVGTGRH